MAEIKQDLTIRGESIQRVYSIYKANNFIVNRKYQRKLVWNVEEKQKFIDSIAKEYPVPLFLLAEVNHDGMERLEIIDGMQRLNAIMSFIDQEFGLIHELNGESNELYFDLDTMAETKLLKDQEIIEQKKPILNRVVCTDIAGYQLPLSTYKIKNNEEIDEIFRRINSGGRQLSLQEVRQSSSTGLFAETVRKIASKIRGDDSAFDVLLLNDMTKISVSNRKLQHYGIDVEDIFWVKQSILSREKVRQSIDEEIIADILGSMILYPDKYTSNTDVLNNLYGLFSTESVAQTERHQTIENNLRKDPEGWINQFISIYDEIRNVLSETNENFNSLLNARSTTSKYAPKHFSTIFLAFYELLVIDRKLIADYGLFSDKFKEASSRMLIQTGAYSGKSKKANIDSVKGIFLPAFRDRYTHEENPSIDRWATRLENILIQSFTEQSLYDFKQGFHRLDISHSFDEQSMGKIAETLTAMANVSKAVTGFVIIGVADNDKDAKRIEDFYALNSIKFNKFNVCGINGELQGFYDNDSNRFYNMILNKLYAQPVDKSFLDNYVKPRLINYYDKTLMIFEVRASDSPIPFGKSFFVRRGSNNYEVQTQDLNALFRKFLQ